LRKPGSNHPGNFDGTVWTRTRGGIPGFPRSFPGRGFHTSRGREGIPRLGSLSLATEERRGDNARDAPVGGRTHQPLFGFDDDREQPLPIPSSPFFAAELLLLRLPHVNAVLLVLTGERHRQIRRHQVSLARLVLLLTTIDADMPSMLPSR
jgi:hypothetical protein